MPQHTAHDLLRAALVQARLTNGMTQATVANVLGRQQSFVSKYESGERTLDVIEFIQICQVVHIDPAKLISRLQGEL